MFSCLFFLIFFIINSFSFCANLENYCIQKNPLNNLCLKCQLDILTPDDNGGCKGAKKCKIGENYCNQCDIQGKICTKCELGYIPDINGGCSYIENCKISYRGECIQCDDNFILIGNGTDFKICKSLILDDFKNCKIINNETGKCLECEEGYFLNFNDKKCTKTENCSESIYGNCFSCIEGYYLIIKNYTCIEKTDNFLYCKQSLTGRKCDLCDELSYMDEHGNCSLSNHCSDSLYGECQKCIENYYLASNKACSIEQNCFEADSDSGICLICHNNYYMDLRDYKCKSNREENDFKYCKAVNNNDECTDCVQDYKLSKDSKCTISIHCLEAENGICYECENNYFLGLDNKCTNDEHCIYSTDFGYCTECEDNYVYNSLFNFCSDDEGIMKNCKFSDGYICHECKSNFYLNYNDSTCINNTQKGPYYKCAYGDSEIELCLECIDGYYLGILDNKCTLNDNCRISEDENTCIECDENYCLDVKKGNCIKNDIIANEDSKFYYACNRTNNEGTECAECIDGFNLGKDGLCVDFSKCIEEKDGECLKCTEEKSDFGYSYCANKFFGCLDYFHEGCLRCNDLLDLYRCTECKDGYTLSIFGMCIKNEE